MFFIIAVLIVNRVLTLPLDETFVVELPNSTLLGDVLSSNNYTIPPLKLLRDTRVYNSSHILLNLDTNYPFRISYNKYVTLSPSSFRFNNGTFDWRESYTLSTDCMTAVLLDSECKLSFKCRFTIVRTHGNIKVCLGFRKLNPISTTLTINSLYSISRDEGLQFLIDPDYIAYYVSNKCCTLIPRRYFYGYLMFNILRADTQYVYIEYEDVEKTLMSVQTKLTRSLPFFLPNKLSFMCDSKQRNLVSADGTTSHMWDVDYCQLKFYSYDRREYRCIHYPSYSAICPLPYVTSTTPILMFTAQLKIGIDGNVF